jgi:RecG-like helicase
MLRSQGFKRAPAVRCWIKHVLEGKFNSEDRTLDTIFGKVRRVRILATLLRKQEYIYTDSFDENQKKVGLKFTIDDGSGIIEAHTEDFEKDQFKKASKGDIFDIIGIVSTHKDSLSIYPTEILRKVEKPDYRLLRDAEIIEKIQSKKIVNTTKRKKPTGKSELKEEIYEIIEQDSEFGISFNDLKRKLDIDDEELAKILDDLERDLRIYTSEQDIYHCL